MKIAHLILIAALVLTLLCAVVNDPAAVELTGQIWVINLHMDPVCFRPRYTPTTTRHL